MWSSSIVNVWGVKSGVKPMGSELAYIFSKICGGLRG